MSLRDDLAAVLGPGNDDRTAYAEADNVLSVLMDVLAAEDRDLQADVHDAWDDRLSGPWPDFQHGRFCPPDCPLDHRVNYGRA